MKQGLKSDFSDTEIIATLFSKLDLTDKLIEDHLKLQDAPKKAKVDFV